MTRHFKKISLLTGLLAVGMLAPSCKKDEPKKPDNPIIHKLHENPFKAVYTLTEGKLADGVEFKEGTTLKSFIPTTHVQALTWSTSTGQGWHIPESSIKQFVVKNTADNPDVVYRLSIEYYNAKGEAMNHQFIDNGQDRIHQHFFSYFKDGARIVSTADLPHEYIYTDTTPWNDPINGQLTAIENPIGFNGLIRFIKPGLKYAINADLMHHPTSKFDKRGKVSPFYAPIPAVGSVATWDINVTLPVVIEGNTPAIPEPQPPVPSTQPQAEKVTIRIVDGHLHGKYGFHQNSYPSQMKYFPVNTTLTYHRVGANWEPAGSNPPRLNLIGGKHSTYAILITYYDAKGDDITGQFAGNTEGIKYQHFFVPTDIKPILNAISDSSDQDVSKVISYTYADTTPWDKTNAFNHAPFTGEDNPIGIKGFFSALKKKREYNLEIRLVHSDGAKAKGDKGFYTPTAEQNAGKWYAPIKIPCFIFIDDEEKALDDMPTSAERARTMTEADLQEDDLRIVKAIMAAYGITFNQALEEMYWNLNGQRPPHSNDGLWF